MKIWALFCILSVTSTIESLYLADEKESGPFQKDGSLKFLVHLLNKEKNLFVNWNNSVNDVSRLYHALVPWLFYHPPIEVTSKIRQQYIPSINCNNKKYSNVLTGNHLNTPRYIIDLVPFGYDVDKLFLRLYELYDHVDLFVIFEFPYTLIGLLKPMYFYMLIHYNTRLHPFLDKILYLPISSTEMNIALNITDDIKQGKQSLKDPFFINTYMDQNGIKHLKSFIYNDIYDNIYIDKSDLKLYEEYSISLYESSLRSHTNTYTSTDSSRSSSSSDNGSSNNNGDNISHYKRKHHHSRRQLLSKKWKQLKRQQIKIDQSLVFNITHRQSIRQQLRTHISTAYITQNDGDEIINRDVMAHLRHCEYHTHIISIYTPCTSYKSNYYWLQRNYPMTSCYTSTNNEDHIADKYLKKYLWRPGPYIWPFHLTLQYESNMRHHKLATPCTHHMGLGAATHLSASVDPIEYWLKACGAVENLFTCSQSIHKDIIQAGKKQAITSELIYEHTVFPWCHPKNYAVHINAISLSLGHTDYQLNGKKRALYILNHSLPWLLHAFPQYYPFIYPSLPFISSSSPGSPTPSLGYFQETTDPLWIHSCHDMRHRNSLGQYIEVDNILPLQISMNWGLQ